jgi:hypothetical protein
MKKLLWEAIKKPIPLSGITKEVGAAVSEIKEKNNYKALIRLAAYLGMGAMMLYLMVKGLVTIEEVERILKAVGKAF